ncbi:MAG: hypothetical protein M3Q48_11840 [Actinomycetota bacterium]|nr:hypothetical protein [Actinomycetota bacterium]
MLIVRSTRKQANQRLTELGRRLLAQADEHLGQHPATPVPLPEPLDSALSSFCGAKGLRRFTVAAGSDTLAVAASVLGTDRYTVDRSIRRLENAAGGIFLRRSSPSRPHRLTDLGQALLSQLEGHLGAERVGTDHLTVATRRSATLECSSSAARLIMFAASLQAL